MIFEMFPSNETLQLHVNILTNVILHKLEVSVSTVRYIFFHKRTYNYASHTPPPQKKGTKLE